MGEDARRWVRDTLTYKGKTQTIAEWSEELDIGLGVLINRVKVGYSDEDTLTVPYKRKVT